MRAAALAPKFRTLRAELPAATFIATTRPEISDVPFDGQLLTVLELSEQQQMDIAREIRGEQGVRLVDEAWRTPGVRELVTTPLYLTALLSLPDGQPFPRTKEEVLRRFVEAHERQAQHAEPLKAVTSRPASRVFERLGRHCDARCQHVDHGHATRAVRSRRRMTFWSPTASSRSSRSLATCSMRSLAITCWCGRESLFAIAFQHQQFQEWYASNDVERAMLESVGDANALQKLKAEILNATPWEEPILFAVERMARGDERQQKACGVAILAAFEVDPILAAEMIFRATDAVWAQISEDHSETRAALAHARKA